MTAQGGFVDDVRQELATTAIGASGAARAELATIVLLARPSVRSDGDAVLTTTSGPLARRLHRLVVALGSGRPEVTVRAPAGRRRRPSYRVRIPAALADARSVRAAVEGRGGDPEAAARWRGALLVGGSVSAPGRPPHLELAVADEGLAARLAADLDRLVPGARVVDDRARGRLVVKSGETIGDLIAAMGAGAAFLALIERRLRRQLRDDTTRAVNADAANLRRSTRAAAAQVEAIDGLVDRFGWEGLPEDLRAVALARVTNPEASLAQLGELLGVARSTVHRRLRGLVALAAGEGPERPLLASGPPPS